MFPHFPPYFGLGPSGEWERRRLGSFWGVGAVLVTKRYVQETRLVALFFHRLGRDRLQPEPADGLTTERESR